MSVVSKVEDSVQEIDCQLERISQGGTEVFSKLKLFGKEMENILSTVQKVEDESKEIRSNLEKSNYSISELNQQISENNTLMNALINKIHHIQEVQSKVEKSIKSLDDIATQTRFLSLNAIIEAGKAGDAGKTFAVIAQEIQALAGVAANTSATVGNLVSQVSNASNQCIEAIGTVETSFEKSRSIVDNVSISVGDSYQNSVEQLVYTEEMTAGIAKGYDVVTSSCALSQGIDLWSSSTMNYFGDLKNSLGIDCKVINNSAAMNLMDFGPRLMIGIPSIDYQHKILVGIINVIYSHLRSGSEGSHHLLITQLEKLAKNTVNHFAFEEEWFKRSSYYEGEAHKSGHDQLLAKVTSFIESLTHNYSYMLSLELMDFLVNWLVNHILGTDRRYVKHLKEHMDCEPNQIDFGF
ncbi:MAG: bacteriohemerythrin [Candidatus Cloacimonetes bacterium]|nr:bacteriohemerythrin [Candidatus Cloacimonadota bacterium]